MTRTLPSNFGTVSRRIRHVLVYFAQASVVVAIAPAFGPKDMVPHLSLGIGDPSCFYCNPVVDVVAFGRVVYCCYFG